MQGAERSEFRIPDSELEGSVELRVPAPPSARLTPMPSDKILFPRRMLYVEAVLYLLIAVVSFGLGYFIGRGGSKTANQQDTAVEKRVPVEGQVVVTPISGKRHGDAGAVVLVLPADKSPDKHLPVVGLRPGDPAGSDDTAQHALADFGGACARTDADGRFTLFVPAPGPYRILVISAQGAPEADNPLEKHDLEQLGKYFDAPADLLKRSRYDWQARPLHQGIKPIVVQFTE